MSKVSKNAISGHPESDIDDLKVIWYEEEPMIVVVITCWKVIRQSGTMTKFPKRLERDTPLPCVNDYDLVRTYKKLHIHEEQSTLDNR